MLPPMLSGYGESLEAQAIELGWSRGLRDGNCTFNQYACRRFILKWVVP